MSEHDYRDRFHVAEHPSGVGVWLVFPANEAFRLTRLGSSEDGETEVMAGTFATRRTFLDWGLRVGRRTVYRYYRVAEDGSETLESEWEATADPHRTWSPLDEPDLYAASRPREAIIVFLSARLAQLARAGIVRVGNENHKIAFPVKANHSFETPELPVIAVDYSSGAGKVADVGAGLTEHYLQVKLDVAASSEAERTSVTDALRELIGELAAFLAALGMEGTEYGNFSHYFIELEPQFYGAMMSIGTTAYGFQRNREDSWELLPVEEPFALRDEDGGGALIGAVRANGWTVLVSEDDLLGPA